MEENIKVCAICDIAAPMSLENGWAEIKTVVYTEPGKTKFNYMLICPDCLSDIGLKIEDLANKDRFLVSLDRDG